MAPLSTIVDPEEEVTEMRRTWEVRSGADLGRAIADIRKSRGMSQAELAAQAALTQDYLSKIERGRTASVLEKILRLLRRLGATVTITVEITDDDGKT